MLRPRIIPCLLVHKGGLVKTQRFTAPKYVGDPINAVKIFNEKEADELMVMDIDASVRHVEPDYGLIKKMAAECRMPLCYGGGIRTPDQAARIIDLGVEKVSLSSAVVHDPGLLTKVASRLGRQSVVATLDVRKVADRSVRYEVYSHNGLARHGAGLLELFDWCQEAGAGEIVVNSIDRDGTMEGYDLDLARAIKQRAKIPVTFLGGAGSHQNIVSLIESCGLVGAAAGSLFVFKGKYRAVLINYPSFEQREVFAASTKLSAKPAYCQSLHTRAP